MNFFKKLFGSQNTSEEVKEEKNFDVLKYDGVRALRMQQFDYAAKCFVLALELNADDLEWSRLSFTGIHLARRHAERIYTAHGDICSTAKQCCRAATHG